MIRMKRCLLVLLTLTVCVFLTEGLLFLFGFKPTIAENTREHYQRRMFTPGLDTQSIPAERDLALSDSLQEIAYPVQTCSSGFLLPGSRHAQPDLKLAFFGGSTTECLFVSPTNRFPWVV